MDTTWNNQMDNYLADVNECTCEASDPDYCTCDRDHDINDFFDAVGSTRKPGIRHIYTGYVLYWKELDGKQIPYITVDRNTAKPVVGAEVQKTALIVEIVGTEDKFGKIIAESTKLLVSVKTAEEKLSRISA